MKKHPTIVIIGAGLTGLTIAYLLKKRGVNATLLEARDRIGGRIHTIYQENSAPIELGATWLGQQHQDLLLLLKELDIPIFEQVLGTTAFYEYLSTSPPQLVQLPPNNAPSFRIKGGTFTLLQRLADSLEEHQIHLEQVVQKIDGSGEGCTIQTTTKQFDADLVISTLPPNLLVSNIAFTPALPSDLVQLSKATHTWMGESIKIAFTFEEAFWHQPNSSGTVMSNVGPVGELYDHSNFENTAFALKGFLNGTFYKATKVERKQLIINQLKKYFKDDIALHSDYLECVWRNEPYTFTPYEEHIFPHQNNGNKLFSNDFMEGKLLIAGSETASNHPGYMNGAVQSAQQVVKKINQRYS